MKFRHATIPLAAAAAASFGAVAVAADTESGPKTGESILLPVPYTTGQAADATMVLDMSVGLGGESVDVTMEAGMHLDVESVADDGSAVLLSEITAMSVPNAPEGADVSELEDLVGITIREEVAPDGTRGDVEIVNADELSSSQAASAEEFAGQAQMVALDFPDEPLAVGDTWEMEESLSSSGIDLPITYACELVALDAESYTIEISFDTDIDTTVDGVEVAGTITGSGSFVGAVDNGLVLDSEFSLSGDLDMSADEMDMAMDMEIDLSYDSEPVDA